MTISELIEYGQKIIEENALNLYCSGIQEKRINSLAYLEYAIGIPTNQQFVAKILSGNIDECLGFGKLNISSKIIENIKKPLDYIITEQDLNNILKYTIRHEIEHIEQFIKMKDSGVEATLLKLSFIFEVIKSLQHRRYYEKTFSEYRANIVAAEVLLTEEELSDNELKIFNMFLAKEIIDSYERRIFLQLEHISPIGFLYKYRSFFKRIGCSPEILDILVHEYHSLSNSALDLINGKNVPDDILNALDGISEGNIITTNLFEKVNGLYLRRKH